MTGAPEPGSLGSVGWAAIATGAWDEARMAFEQALSDRPSAENYEGLAWAAWWQLDVTLLFEARREAYQRYREAGDVVAAARVAGWIGTDHLDFKGESIAANGWFRRARRLLEGVEPTPEHGWLAVHEAPLALFYRGDATKTRQLGAIAAQLARRHGQGDLEMLGMATEGLAMVAEGRLDDGMGLLDEATAMALSGEWIHSVALPWACCYMIYACELAHDHERAAEWCVLVADIAEQQGLPYMWGLCRAHHAAVLVLQGEWTDAEQELQDAAKALEKARPHWLGEATVRLGELRRRQGRISEASQLFRLAEGDPLALIGLGHIALDRGTPAQARDLAARALRAVPEPGRTERAAALQLLVCALVALGDQPAASDALAELEALAVVVGTSPLKAAAAYCAGTYAASFGDLDTARHRFEDAVGFAERARLPYEAARARLELAVILVGLGRTVEGREQAAQAETELKRLGADVDAMRAAGLVPAPSSDGEVRLTPREREVLALVARGMSDRRIAASLFLSEHTVHRHISNVLTKLGCPTRAAAVARAATAGLLGRPTA
ncbi:MAG TPA: LuxR C-terminal-related transcriptional regulator [Jiangellaceae bacterium]